jgi:hypothetical protein
MCSFRTLSCGDTVHDQTPGEQRLKKEVIHDFFFCGVSARLRRVRKEPHITAQALQHLIAYSAS